MAWDPHVSSPASVLKLGCNIHLLMEPGQKRKQGASHKHCFIMDVSLIVQESIAYMRDEDSDVYVAVLDTRKAFTLFWHYGLFWKL